MLICYCYVFLVLTSEFSASRCTSWLSDKHFVVGFDNGDIMLYDLSKTNQEICKNTLNFPIHNMKYNERYIQKSQLFHFINYF